MLNINNLNIDKIINNLNGKLLDEYKEINNYIFHCYFINKKINSLYLEIKIYHFMKGCNKLHNYYKIFEDIFDKISFISEFKLYLIKEYVKHNLDNILLYLINNCELFKVNIVDYYCYVLNKYINNEILLNNILNNIKDKHLYDISLYFNKFIYIISNKNENSSKIITKLFYIIKDKDILCEELIEELFNVLIQQYIYNSLFDKNILLLYYNIYKKDLINLIDNLFIYNLLYNNFENINNYLLLDEIVESNLVKKTSYTDLKFLIHIDKYFTNKKCKYITEDYIVNILTNIYDLLSWLLIENDELLNIEITNKLLFYILYMSNSQLNIDFFDKLLKNYRYTTREEKRLYYLTKHHKIYNQNDEFNKNEYKKIVLLWNYLIYGINKQNYKIFNRNIKDTFFIKSIKNIYRTKYKVIERQILITFSLYSKNYNDIYNVLDLDNTKYDICDIECPISFEKCNMITVCKHKFNFDAFIKWYIINKNCPICRSYNKLIDCKKIIIE